MTVAILDVRPTVKSGVGLFAGGAKSFVPRFTLEPRQLHRRRLLCRWHLDRAGRPVCVWQSGLMRLPVGLK